MDGNDKELGWETSHGWEDVGGNIPLASTIGAAAVSGAMGQMGQIGDGAGGGGGGAGGEIGDAVTNAMVSHLAREISKSSLSIWPQFLASARQYFNVTHGYVLRKVVWQLVPLTQTKKKSAEGEITGNKDWSARMFEGLEVEIEAPDLYIPTMGFVTYVLLCGLIGGLKEEFKPEVLSATINYALALMVLEAVVTKGVLFAAGAAQAPAVDLVSVLGYKYFYLSVQLFAGLILGWGWKPVGFFYHLISLGLFASCGVALWQALRRLPRLQPSLRQECVSDVHKLLIKGIPVLQALVVWALLPHWPKARPAVQHAAAKAAAAVLESVAETTSLAPLVAVANATAHL